MLNYLDNVIKCTFYHILKTSENIFFYLYLKMSTILKNTVIPLYLNSRDRINISEPTTNYTFKLRKDLRNISSITVSNVGIPKTFTNINKNNNTLLISFSAEGKKIITFPIIITVTSKDYTMAELATALQNALDLNATSTEIGLDWTVTFITDTKFYTITVQYDAGSSFTWGIKFTYTPFIDILGIGDGGTTENSYSYTALEMDLLTIPVNRRSILINNLHFNIASKALTNDINTSYVTSLAKSFTVMSSNALVAFDTKQTLTNYSSQLTLGTESIGDVFFGYSVGISGDGNTTVVGAYADDGYTGSVYTYKKQTNGVDYFQTPTGSKTQTTSPTTSNGREGISVAISNDGFTMITGASEDDWVLLGSKRLGAAYIYAWTGSQWVQQLKIIPTTSTPVDQQLGLQVAISGDGLYAAASGIVETQLYVKDGNKWEEGKRFPFTTNPQLNDEGTIMTLFNPGSGNIQVYLRVGSTWTLGSSLPSSYPVIDMSDTGDTLVVSGNGSVDVYYDSGGYTLDGGAPLVKPHSEFGTSVSISGDGKTISVGDPTTSPGKIWIYNKPASTWILHSQFSGVTTSSTNPFQGFSVRLNTNGEVLVVGGPVATNNIGAAWIWKLDTNDDTWKEVENSNPLQPIGYSADTDQGYSSAVASGGSTFVTGGPLDKGGRGAVWVYNRIGFLWDQYGTKIVPSDITDTVARFGHAVDISSDGLTIAVGSPQDFGAGSSISDDTGAVWIFRLSNSIWTQEGLKLYGVPSSSNNQQGRSVSLSADGNILAIGAPKSTVPNSGDGEVFIFVYDLDTKSWNQQGTVLSHTGLSTSSSQGWSVALDDTGETLVVGAPGDDAVAIFNRNDTTWTEDATLLKGTGDRYGATVCISSDGSTIAIGAPGVTAGDTGYVSIRTYVGGSWVEQKTFTETPFGSSVDLSEDGNVLCVGALDGLSQVDITSRTYAYTRTGFTWSQHDDPIVGEKRTNTEDYQGFSSSVAYLDDSKDFVLIVGGIGFGAFQGGNWSYISGGVYDTVESYTLPVRAYTIFDLINVLNLGMAIPLNVDFVYSFDIDAEQVKVSIDTDAHVTSTFKLNSTNTFDIFEFVNTAYITEMDSVKLDFSINNNVIKTINTSSTNSTFIYDVTADPLYRKYEAGYSLLATDTIDIQLRDERDRIVDLYGSDWIMTAYVTIHN
jgi:hypothetical protein